MDSQLPAIQPAWLTIEWGDSIPRPRALELTLYRCAKREDYREIHLRPAKGNLLPRYGEVAS
jgi:hypothetical protein